MFDILAIGATGMQAQQVHVETIAHNLANTATPGFKKGRVGFAELMLSTPQPADAQLQPAQAVPGRPGGLGAGVAATGVLRSFEAGELRRTDAPMDLAIQGDAFIEVALPDGSPAYARGGSLRVGSDGLLATAAGHALRPAIPVPTHAQGLQIERDGTVRAHLPGQSGLQELGQIGLVRFRDPSQLASAGTGLYQATPAAGDAQAQRAGDADNATLVQGALEASNVRLVDEMVNLMLAQRAYEASVKVVQAADELLGLVNGLRK